MSLEDDLLDAESSRNLWDDLRQRADGNGMRKTLSCFLGQTVAGLKYVDPRASFKNGRAWRYPGCFLVNP